MREVDVKGGVILFHGSGAATPNAETPRPAHASVSGYCPARTLDQSFPAHRQRLTRVASNPTCGIFQTPVLIRLSDELIADAAQGLWLLDNAGRPRKVTTMRWSASCPIADGPYHLQDDQCRVLAISW